MLTKICAGQHIIRFSERLGHADMAGVRGISGKSRHPAVASNARFNSGHKSCRDAGYRRVVAPLRAGRARRHCRKKRFRCAQRKLIDLGGEVFLSRSFVEGLIARMTKDEGKARSAFVAARAEQEKVVQAQPNDSRALGLLGLIDAYLGRKEEALREGRRAVELVPVEKDALEEVRGGESGNDRSLGWRQRSRLRTTGEHHPSPELSQLWRAETIPVVGPSARRSALRKTPRRSQAAGRAKVNTGRHTRRACWFWRLAETTFVLKKANEENKDVCCLA